MSRHRPSRSALRRAFRLRLLRLLRPLLTSGSTSSASGFHPQGQISPGKNAILHRTTAASTPPDLWPQELCRRQPARPGRQRLISGSCPSAHGLRSTLPPHARSPSRSCASLASLWPAQPGTCTPKIAPMLGALSFRASGPPFSTCVSQSPAVLGPDTAVARVGPSPERLGAA